MYSKFFLFSTHSAKPNCIYLTQELAIENRLHKSGMVTHTPVIPALVEARGQEFKMNPSGHSKLEARPGYLTFCFLKEGYWWKMQEK